MICKNTKNIGRKSPNFVTKNEVIFIGKPHKRIK